MIIQSVRKHNLLINVLLYHFSHCRPQRFHKLVWSPHGMDGAGHPNGVLIAGGENGDVILYDPAKIMAGDDDVIITQSDKHTGPVRALDVNPFQVRPTRPYVNVFTHVTLMLLTMSLNCTI